MIGNKCKCGYINYNNEVCGKCGRKFNGASLSYAMNKNDDDTYTTRSKFLLIMALANPLIQFLLTVIVLCSVYYFVAFGFNKKEEIKFTKKIETYGIVDIKFDSRGKMYGSRDNIYTDVECADFNSTYSPFSLTSYTVLRLTKDNKWTIPEREKENFSKNKIENILVECLPKLDKALVRQQKINESWK